MVDLSPKELAQSLVEKHDNMISAASDELEKSRQIAVLKEKADQLAHWVLEKDGDGKFEKELEETRRELEKLSDSFKPKSQSYYKGLSERIDEHKKARDYWLGKVGELKT
jgi:hypothetical protein